jgi:hypothetical protein
MSPAVVALGSVGTPTAGNMSAEGPPSLPRAVQATDGPASPPPCPQGHVSDRQEGPVLTRATTPAWARSPMPGSRRVPDVHSRIVTAPAQ